MDYLEQIVIIINSRNLAVFLSSIKKNMSKIKSFSLFLLIGICFCCSNDELTQEQENQNLNLLFSEIENMATSVTCSDPSEWTYTSYGNKPCGGPVGYIAYSRNINTFLFLQKIEEHRIKQLEYNIRWKLISDCSVPPQPIEMLCENGNAILVY